MAESEELLLLRRRARRRLLGAIALLLFLVIVPPMLMDLEPRPVSSNLSVEIPPRDTRLVAPAEPKPASGEVPEAPAGPGSTVVPPPASPPEIAPSGVPRSAGPRSAVTGEVVAKPTPTPEQPSTRPQTQDAARPDSARPAPRDESPKTAAAVDPKETYYVQLGVFSRAERVTEVRTKATEAGIRIYAEQVKGESGEQTRLRAGPFASREAAERARVRLEELGKTLGFKPGPVRANEKRA